MKEKALLKTNKMEI